MIYEKRPKLGCVVVRGLGKRIKPTRVTEEWGGDQRKGAAT